MNIAFYYIRPDGEVHPHIEYCIHSIKKFMPTAKIVQVTDRKTKAVDGVDQVFRFRTKTQRKRVTLNYRGFEFLSKLDLKEMVFIDPDMMFNADVEPLMKEDFEIAVSARSKVDGERLSTSYMRRYPYCSLMFIKTPEFWKDCYKMFSEWPDELTWITNMRIVGNVINSGKYKVRVLDGDIYNRPVHHKNDFNKDTKVYHFKGSRNKRFMKSFYERFINHNCK
jgi:hypothetical protein